MEILITLLLLFTRVSCVVMTAPILGSRVVAMKYKVLLSGLISVAALPVATSISSIASTASATSSSIANSPAAGSVDIASLFTAFTSEVVIGVMLGLGVAIMFAAAQAAGSVMGQMAGQQWPSQTSAEGESMSPLAQLFAMISLAAFALIGGPELVLKSLLDTCVHLPLGSSLSSQGVIGLLTELLQQSFLLTLRGVGPAIAALMISTIVIGLISRTYPQMNMLGIGLSSNQFVLFLAVFLTLGGCVWLFVDDLGDVIAMIQTRLIDLREIEPAATVSQFTQGAAR